MAKSHNILITGGSFGLGLAMARHFVAGGHHVVVCGRDQGRLDAARAELPGIVALRADITRADDRAALMAEATRADHPVDIFINNAAITRAHDYTNAFTLGADRAREEIEINFAAPVELIRMFLDWRLKSGRTAEPASIVNISTPGALFPLDANPLYTSSKAGFHNFTLALRRHMRGTAVKVIEVFPPALATGLTAGQLDVPSEKAMDDKVIDEVAARTVAGILAGEEVISPHEQAEQMVKSFGGLPDDLVEMINSGVHRRAGWDQPHGA
jgi:uncharacterized oxidoreductase